MNRLQKIFFMAMCYILFTTCFVLKSYAQTHFCLCYQEIVNGKATIVTTCRQKSEQCESLSNKVLYKGSRAIIKGSLSYSCTQVYQKDKLGIASGWKPSAAKGGSWYPGRCLLKQKPNFLTHLKHVAVGYDKQPSLIKITEKNYKKGEKWKVLTKDGAKDAEVVASGTGGDAMNGTWFGIVLSVKDYLMALPSATWKGKIKYKSVTSFDIKKRLPFKKHKSLYKQVHQHVRKSNQSKKLKNLSLSILPYRIAPYYDYLIYLKFDFPNQEDPRNNVIHQIYTYNANDKKLVILNESNCHFSIDWIADLDMNQNHEIHTSADCIESPTFQELIYMNDTTVYKIVSEH